MRQPAIAEQRRRRTPHEIQKRNVDLWHGKEPSGYCTAGDSSLMMPWASGEGLVTSPKRAATFTRSNWSSGERERCAIIVDRHVHKNGGSTMRDIFLENERLGYGLYQGYTQLLWRQDFAVLQRIAERAVAEKRSPNHFIMMEAHFGFEEFANRPLSDLVRLKQLYQAAGVRCPIALMTRVREPLAYYLSFYKWGVAFRIQEALTKGEVQPQWGRNFSEWARQVPNLQSSIMVRGMTAMGAEYSGRIHASRRTIGPAGGRGWEELDNMLSKFDVVGTTQRFDETLLLAADMVGLPVLAYKYNRPKAKGGFRGGKADICPDMEACRALVKEVAPRDVAMWEKYGKGFVAKLQTLGPAFERRVADFQAEVRRTQPAWKAAPRAQTICRYHPETDPSPARTPVLAGSNLRCPVEEGLELCQQYYAHRLFECPWQYVPNSSLTDPLGCWRPSSGFL